jgi:hypothetical protein
MALLFLGGAIFWTFSFSKFNVNMQYPVINNLIIIILMLYQLLF